jgi:Rrf2 family protein
MDNLLLAWVCSPDGTVNLLVACATQSIIYHRYSEYFGGWGRDGREWRDQKQGKDGRLHLELSSEGRYALRALLYLAWLGERASAERISAEANVPRRLLARILASLARAGLVESEQGRGGGSRLARPAREITLLDAVEAAEGPFGVTRCIMQNRACDTAAPCAMHDAWEEGQQAILKYLQKQSLEDFTAQNPSGRFPPRG